MQLAGIKDLLPFLNFLKREKIFFRIDHTRADAVMVTFTLVAMRIELDFFDDHIEFSCFSGDESVESEPALLFKLIEEHWGD